MINFETLKIKKYSGIKYLMVGTAIAKILGIWREFYVLSSFQFSLEYSYYLSLIAIVSIFTLLGDISILNPILFPRWVKQKGITLPIFSKGFLLISLFICVFTSAYNFYLIPAQKQSVLFVIATSTIIFPLIINSFLYSALVFQEKFKQFSIVAIINASLYLLATLLFINKGVSGYLLARWITLLMTFIFLNFFLDQSNIFYGSLPKFSIKKSLNNVKIFFSVNLVLWFSALLKVVFSILGKNSEITILTYALIIALTFYTVVGKNINTYAIKNQLLENFNFKNSIILNSLLFIFFLTFLILLRFFVLYNFDFLVSLFENKNEVISTIDTAILLSPFITFLGFFDLYNQSKIKYGFSKSHLFKTTIILSINLLISILLTWLILR